MRRQDLIASFLRLEAAVGLLTRSKPVNFGQEANALLLDWQSGRKRNPKWYYASTGDCGQMRSLLRELHTQVRRGPWSVLWSARCEELAHEISLVEAIGTPAMPRLSGLRFGDSAMAQEAFELACEWIQARPDTEAIKQQTDAIEATSLLNQMQATVARERLPFRVLTSDALVSAAATGDGVIWVASGKSIFAEEVPRIVVHEVLGHAWPRTRAVLEECELFAVGSARGNDTQEGYAVWQEVITGTQTPRRRQELALRHFAALCVWQGADWVQTVEHLVGRGASLAGAQNIALRAHRGGGLAREAIYLQTFCELRSALLVEPNLALWLGSGRLNLEAIASLRAMGYRLGQPPSEANQRSNSAMTGM